MHVLLSTCTENRDVLRLHKGQVPPLPMIASSLKTAVSDPFQAAIRTLVVLEGLGAAILSETLCRTCRFCELLEPASTILYWYRGHMG